jgi:hypothetical protein
MSIKYCTRLIVCLIALTARASKAEEKAISVPALPAPYRAEEFKTHVVYLASDELGGRAPGSDGAAKAAAYIVQCFKEIGLKPALAKGSWIQEFPLGSPDRSSGSVTAKNVLSIFPGRGRLASEAVIVCAHYDHLGKRPPRREGEDSIYNGADDNASGVAAMVLIAKALAAEKQSLPQSFRSVLFISFDGEERGLAGSQFYVRRPAWPLEKTSAVVNFDSMGRLHGGKFIASDAETNRMLAECVRDSARERGLVAETRFGGHGRSDHAVFLDRSIPSMHFTTGVTKDYHQVTDHWQLLDLEASTNIAWVGYKVVQKAIAYPGRIEFQKTDPAFDMSFLLNVAQTLGVVPNLGAQDGKYPQILFVMPKSAAAKSGVRAGDQITAVNGLVFTRLEDGLTILPQLSLEDGLRVSLLRGNQKTEAVIPPSVFEGLSGPKSKRLENGKYDVEFRFKAAANVKAVYVAGEFNAWKPTAIKMDGPAPDGSFTAQLQLNEGAYEYKFVVDGEDWVADPKNLYRVGKSDNSLLWVGPRHK